MADLTLEEERQLAGLQDPDTQDSAQYQWDETFQRHIISMLLKDRGFLVQSLPLIEPSYFTNEVHQWIARILFGHFETYRHVPHVDIIRQEVNEKVQGKKAEIKQYYRQEVDAIYEYYQPGIDSREYLLDKITNFAKRQAMKLAFGLCWDEIKKSPEDESTWAKVHDILRDAMQVERNVDIGLDYFGTMEERYERMRIKLETGDIFTSGFEPIDKALMGGGLLRGQIGSWIGISGTGKSLALVCASLENMHRGKKVLYVSTEMDQDSVGQRFDARLADPAQKYGVEINNLLDHPNVVIQGVNEYISEYDDRQRLIIKQFPSGEMGVSEFRAYYAQCVLYGFQPDLVVIDYIGEMKDYPKIPIHESRYKIVRNLRGFAVEEQVCILTAMQPNRTAKEVVKAGDVIDDENLGDSYSQIKPLDAFWSINQLKLEKNCGLARVYVIKHRAGKSGFNFHVDVNDKTLAITPITQQEYSRRKANYEKEREISGAEKTEENLRMAARIANFNKATETPEKGEIAGAAALGSKEVGSADPAVDAVVKPVDPKDVERMVEEEFGPT